MAPLGAILTTPLMAAVADGFVPRTLSWLDYTTLTIYFAANLLIG